MTQPGISMFVSSLTELITANFQALEHGTLMFEYLRSHKQPGKPLMVMEFWSGWFDHWAEKHAVWPIQGDVTAAASVGGAPVDLMPLRMERGV